MKRTMEEEPKQEIAEDPAAEKQAETSVPMDVDQTTVASPPSSPDEDLLKTDEELPPYNFDRSIVGHDNNDKNSSEKNRSYIYASSLPIKTVAVDSATSKSYNDAYFGAPSLATTTPRSPQTMTNTPRNSTGDPYVTRVPPDRRDGSSPSETTAPSPTPTKRPSGPTVTPIRRRAKFRPYADQNLPVTPHEIRQALPDDATAVLHILDRRVNMDALHNTGGGGGGGGAASRHPTKDVHVPVYALLRAWVQDDPYRQIPPRFPMVTPGDMVRGEDPAGLVARQRGRRDNRDTLVGKRPSNGAVVDIISSLAPSNVEAPSMETLKQQVVKEARQTRTRKTRASRYRWKKTLQGLRQRGILLGETNK